MKTATWATLAQVPPPHRRKGSLPLNNKLGHSPMNSDYPKSLSVDSVIVDHGWFGTVAYAVDLIAAIVLLYLLIRNAMALCQSGASAITQVQIRFRLLLSKRLTQVLGLFCAFQFCQFLAYALFMLATPESKSATVVVLMTYAYQPIPFTFGVLAFGMVQYAILDAALRHKAIKDGVKDQPQPPPGN